MQAHSDKIWDGEYYGLHTLAIQHVSIDDTNDADLKYSAAHSVSEVNRASLPFSLQCTVDVDDMLVTYCLILKPFIHCFAFDFNLIVSSPLKDQAMLWLTCRYSISQMDVAPRQSFVAGIVLPQERTVMLGVINVVKSLAASFGPLATGYLAANNMWRWSFFSCGGLKIVYDMALLISARHLKPDSEQSLTTPSS